MTGITGSPNFRAKMEVPLVVGGDAHDRAGAVAEEHIVRNPNGDLLAVDGIYGVCAQENPGFLLLRGGTLDFCEAIRCFLIGFYFGAALGRGELGHKRMLGSQNEESRAPKGVGSRGEDGDFLAGLSPKDHLRPF
jgi:hypothetical protein